MKRCVLIAAGTIESSSFSALRPDDYIICVDGGYRYAKMAGITPDIILGDFDSIQEPEDIGVPLIVFPSEKDETDTALALEYGIAQGCDTFLLLGGTGTRLDHFYANLILLIQMKKRGFSMTIQDSHNEIFALWNESVTLEKNEGEFISVFSWDSVAEKLTEEGTKYLLSEYRLSRESNLGVSNECREAVCRITVTDGLLLVFRSKD